VPAGNRKPALKSVYAGRAASEKGKKGALVGENSFPSSAALEGLATLGRSKEVRAGKGGIDATPLLRFCGERVEFVPRDRRGIGETVCGASRGRKGTLGALQSAEKEKGQQI